MGVIGLSGCGNKRDDNPQVIIPEKVPPTAEQNPPLDVHSQAAWLTELLQFHNQAPTVTADLLIRVREQNGNAILFQINLWCPADGRVRLKCSKLDVDFIEALVQPNGDFVLELVRSKELVRGNLRDIHVFDKNGAASGPPFLAYLSVLVNEAKNGPVPAENVTKAANGEIIAKDAITKLDVKVTVNPDKTVASKQYFDAPDKEAVRLDYQRYDNFDRLKRPTRMQLSVPGDKSEYTLRLRSLDAVPAIPAAHMRFDPSSGVTEITLEMFLKRLQD